jgi:hypothetical protein
MKRNSRVVKRASKKPSNRMRRNSRAYKELLLRQASKGKVRVPLEYLRDGDLIEYIKEGFRNGKVESINLKTRTVKVRPPAKSDLSKKWRSLVDFKREVKDPNGYPRMVRYTPRGVNIHEAQVTAFVVGKPGKRVTLRPDSPEYDEFVGQRGTLTGEDMDA